MNTERPDNDDDAREAGTDADAPEVGEPGTADAGSSADAGTSAKAGAAPETAEPEEVEEVEEVEKSSGASEAPGEDTQTADAKAASEGGDAEPPAEEPATPDVAGTGARAETAETPASEDRQTGGGSAPASPEPAGNLQDEAGDLPRHDRDVRDVRDEEDLVRHDGGRPRTPAIIASVAAAVLLIGGGGAWLASNASSGSGGGATSGAPGGDGTPPQLALDGYSESTAGGGNGIAPGEPNPYGATYRVGGPLPAGPGKAPVYRARGEVTEADVARLAKALGVEGTPVAQGEAWKIGGRDGSGPSLQVNRQAPGSWTFSRYAPGTDNCKGDTCTAPQSGGGTPVSEEVAEKAAAPVLKAVGQDDAKRDASQIMGAQRVVNAAPEVGGLPTHGWTTGITVGSDGEVVGGSGQLKTPVKGDTYPVVGAAKALELMNGQPKNDHRMGIGGCASPVPLKDRLEQPCEQPSSGASGQDTVTVEKAVFGLAAHVVDGRQALVPSWLFEVTAPGAEDPFTVTYPAVEPRYLASPEPSEPSDRPTAAPGPREVKVDGYRAEGSELTVTFTGGVCADYDVKASEKGDEVTVSVTSTPWPDKVCVMIAKQFQEKVRLDEPLGDRAVVNADGKAVPLAKEGARLPAPPTRER
ncbi:hypothetical protein ACFZBC_22260 [Streptomyces luteogriseus]|uniref:hypothetical protein n=1 Tax=Streptomyces luteogriseus TaxID=68233 RepID=UPI0036E9E2D3